MALVTVEGTCEDGKIALAELPAGLERAPVVVTFLPNETVRSLEDGARHRLRRRKIQPRKNLRRAHG